MINGMKIVQINFQFTVEPKEYDAVCQHVAKKLAEVPGLNWKAWLINEQRREAGGIYLFDNAAAAVRYVNGPIVENVKSAPGIKNVEIKLFDILEGPSKLTRFLTAHA
jgi:hypothetical protein